MSAIADRTLDKERAFFDDIYKPHKDKFLTSEIFQIADAIMDAIRNPLRVDTFDKENDEFTEIIAIFAGERVLIAENEKFNVAFQRFRKEITFQQNGTICSLKIIHFFLEKRFGINISDNIDCFYTEDETFVIPNDKEKVKTIHCFLDEEAYKRPFSKKLI